MIRLRLYSRPGCGLCEELEETLEREFGSQLVIEWHDVDRDPVARERYGLRIPVLTTTAGELLSAGRLDRERLQHYLRAASV